MGGMMPPPGGPGGGQLDGPPPQPPGTPSLAGIPPAPGGGPGMGAGPNQAGALPRLVFEIENSLKTLARALPGTGAEEIDSIIQQLRNIVAQALQGSSSQPASGGAPPTGAY